MREKHLTVISPDEAVDGQWHGLRYGSESCVRLLPEQGALGRIRDEYAERFLTLATPLCGPDEIIGIAAMADRALDLGWDEVVVNDWGLLSRLSGRWGGRMCAGRLLLKLRRGPGWGDPWEDLDGESRRYFAWGPLYDSALLSVLDDLGVVRLEVDPPRHWMPLPATEQFLVSFHGDARLVSISGRCPWLYDPAEDCWRNPEPGCLSCRESGPLLMYAQGLSRPLIQWGREILEEASDAWREEDLPDSVDRIIYSNFPIAGTINASK